MTSTPQDAMLDILIEDLDQAEALYKPTQFWRAALNRLTQELRGNGLNRFRSLPGSLSFFVPTYSFPGYHNDSEIFSGLRKALGNLQLGDIRCATHLERLLSGESQAESDYRVLLASDTPVSPFFDQFSESSVAEPIEQFEFDGRRFSRSSLNYLLGLAFLKRHCDLSSIRNVLEIGGGFGTLGEILLNDSRNDFFYIDVDIPPTVHCAHHYLQNLYGSDAILSYAKTRYLESLNISGMAAKHKAAILPSWQLPRLHGKIDLFVNFISFQEMEPNVVRNYLLEVARLGADYVLLRNIREGKAKAVSPDSVGVIHPILGEMYDAFLGGYQLIASNIIPFGCHTVDGFNSELRLYHRR